MPSPTTPITRRASGGPNRVWMVLGLLVLLAGVIAVLASLGGSGDKVATSTSTSAARGATGSTALAPAETQPVHVVGQPLPRYDGDPDPAAGRPIPEVDGASFDGKPVTIKTDGRPKLVLFVAHWCPHCQREVPRLSEYLRANPLPDDVDLLTVATATTPDRPNYPPSAWLAREQWPGKVILADTPEGSAAEAFGLSAYPFFAVVDADGKVVARTSGELTTAQFAELVQRARA